MTGYSPALPPEVWMDHVVIDQRRVAEAYLRDELEPQERDTFARHLKHCEECRDRVTLAQFWLPSRNSRPGVELEVREPGLVTQEPAAETEVAGAEESQGPRSEEPLVTRVAVRPEDGASVAEPNPGEMFTRPLEKQNADQGEAAVPTSGESPLQTSAQTMTGELFSRAAEQPTLRSQFATWQLVILGVLLGLFLMAIPAAYLLVQVRRQIH